MNRDEEIHTQAYLNTKQLGTLLGISRTTIYRLVTDGMPCIQVRGLNRFPKNRVLSWLEGDDDTEKAQAILQEAQEILEEIRNMQKQGETAGQKR